jgi:hypothetical protein
MACFLSYAMICIAYANENLGLTLGEGPFSGVGVPGWSDTGGVLAGVRENTV